VQAAGDDQALDDADVFGAEFGPAKEPGFSAHRNDSQCSLDMVGIDGNIGVGEKDFEPCASLADIVERLNIRIARGEALSGEFLLDLGKEMLAPSPRRL
jgi:hypothetical protein